MDYRQRIISELNKLYFDSIEEFREAEAKIANDSKFRKIFNKKDYAGNIEMLKKCKGAANSISFPVSEIPKEDHDSAEIVDKARECVRAFNKLCDAYISMQVTLDKKAGGEDISYKEYKQTYNLTRERHAEMNSTIKELDILYADYIEENEVPEAGYMTYDMLSGGNE